MSIAKRITIHDTDTVYTFETKDILGFGAFSDVYIGKNVKTNLKVAIKVIYIPRVGESCSSEVIIHKEITSHPNIVKFIDCARTKDNLYIITELCEGGTLRKMLNKAPGMRIQEHLAVQYLAAVVDAVGYMHEKGIVHRDVKPENLFFKDEQIKLGDFGSATYADLSISHRGSPQYLAPEMLLSYALPYDKQIDVWALGVIFYEMLFGDLITREDIGKIEEKIDCQAIVKGFEVSMEARELLKEMLKGDPDRRITMQRVKEHKLFKKHEEMKEESYMLLRGVKEALEDEKKGVHIVELLKENNLQAYIETNELVIVLEESLVKRL